MGWIVLDTMGRMGWGGWDGVVLCMFLLGGSIDYVVASGAFALHVPGK